MIQAKLATISVIVIYVTIRFAFLMVNVGMVAALRSSPKATIDVRPCSLVTTVLEPSIR